MSEFLGGLLLIIIPALYITVMIIVGNKIDKATDNNDFWVWILGIGALFTLEVPIYLARAILL